MNEAPLSNLKVLDLSRVLAGPFTGRLLADLGAEVVKIEPPGQDITRKWGKQIGGISGFYHQQNAGKKNVCIDLKQASGVALLKQLVEKADVLLENFRPGVMHKLGLAWEDLQPINPSLIMVSISGFGQEGPESRRPAYAPIVHAETGNLLRQAAKTNGDIKEMSMALADTNAGLHGLVGLLAALVKRQETGRGQHVDIAMVDAMLFNDEQTNFFLDQVQVTSGVSEVWQATGGPLMIAGDAQHIWAAITHRLGVADHTAPDASADEKTRARRAALQDYLLSFDSRSALLETLDKANLAYGDVFDTGEFLNNSPTIKHRASIQHIDDRSGGTRPTFQSPYRFSHSPSGVRHGAPHLGEHNQSVLQQWLDLNDAEIADLEKQAVLQQ